MRWGRLAAVICVLVCGLATSVGTAAAEESDSAPIRPLADGGFNFPEITGSTSPEEYPFELEHMSPEIRVRQIGDQKVIGEYIEGGYTAWTIEAVPASDAVGATVPTTVKLTEGDIVTLTVHYRAGNPVEGNAPFVFPIREGEGWKGGWFTGTAEMYEPKSPTTQSSPPPICTAPSLRGLSLRAAKIRLRAAHCSVGKVRLAPGTTAGKGKVVSQSYPAGTDLATGAPVAIKLGPRRPA